MRHQDCAPCHVHTNRRDHRVRSTVCIHRVPANLVVGTQWSASWCAAHMKDLPATFHTTTTRTTCDVDGNNGGAEHGILCAQCSREIVLLLGSAPSTQPARRTQTHGESEQGPDPCQPDTCSQPMGGCLCCAFATATACRQATLSESSSDGPETGSCG